MKTTAFFALALAAVLLGSWQDPPPHGRPAGHSAGAPDPQMPAATASWLPPAHAAIRPARQAAPLTPAGAGTPSPGALPPPASAPALTAAPVVALGDAASASDWRDNALDLLSQIGLLCPTAGCDSLEDD